MNIADIEAGMDVLVPATVEERNDGYAYLLRTQGVEPLFWVRTEDLRRETGNSVLFGGRVTWIDGDTVAVTVFSPTDEYTLRLGPDAVAEEMPYTEQLSPGHLYADRARRFGDTWLYDGEAFYPVKSFPEGALDRDEMPKRLHDLGHVSDYC